MDKRHITYEVESRRQCIRMFDERTGDSDALIGEIIGTEYPTTPTSVS